MTTHLTPERTWLAWLALAPFALFFLAGCGNTEAKLPAKPEEASKPIVVSLTPAEERSLPSALDVTGSLMADAQTEVGSEIEQRVVEIQVERGQAVAAGQVIARLESQDAVNQLREAEAIEAQTRERLGLTAGQPFDALKTPEVRQARVITERAEADYQRYAGLLAEGAISRSEHDLKRAEYLAAKEQCATVVNQMRQLYQTLQAQKARVAMARKALEDTVLRAPFAGLIAEKHVNVGRFLKKGDRVATVVRVDPLRIELTIPEGAATAVRKGQKVSFGVQTYPDRRFEGTIAYIGPALRVDSRALVVEAIVPNHQGLLQPGLFATARIELPAVRPSLMVPISAVRTEGGVFTLYVVRSDRAELRIVHVGREVGELAEILRGLSAGEQVVRRLQDGLTDGALVAVAK